MEFALGIGSEEYEVRLVGADPGVTIGDALASAVEDVGAFVVDGTAVGSDTALAAVARPGSRIELHASATLPASPSSDSLGGGRRAFNRPPRSEFPVALPPIPAPSPREAPTSRFRFGWPSLIVPVVLGIVLAVLIHPRMAIFAVFSPAMALANWWDDRRRTRKGARRTSEQLRDELAAFRTRLIATVAAEQRLRGRSHPDPAALVARVEGHDPRLWERRRHHDDAMTLAVGTACVAWEPRLETGYDGPAPEARDLVDELGTLHDVPIALDLRSGSVVGIAGHPSRRRELATSLVVQAAVLHGPSDLTLTVVTDHADHWDWVKWLPHTVIDLQTGRRRLAASPQESAVVLDGFAAVPEPAHHLGGPVDRPLELLVVDVEDLAHPAYGSVRDGIERAVTGAGAVLTLSGEVTSLSSRCRVVIGIDADGTAELRAPDRGRRITDIASWRLSMADGRRVARRLAGVTDPDLREGAAELPQRVRLVDLLDMPHPSADAVAARWARNAGRDPAVPVGATTAGSFAVSLVADGPHALLAGTTGAGKSEFLRTLVASLAVASSPDDLTFVLVDYKGGSAFDVCARLPHTVGMVTDLDGHLAQRALTCLEAELRYREERLRAVGAADLGAYRASPADEPLPRLFVVVDEFAALAKELPEFMASLIDVAQRGRSLGVHLLLATQRPQGVINDQIRANTNLRIALRVQDPSDSNDVIGTRDAASIGRSQAGRGYVRLGAGEVKAFQAALVTGPSSGPPAPELRPFTFAAEQAQAGRAAGDPDMPTDLDVLVSAVTAAHEQLGIAPPRRPWPEPLPAELGVGDLGEPSRPMHAVFALADEPSLQRRRSVTWTPSDGNLLLYGVAGSGTTTALATLGIELARATSPDRLHLYVLDFDDQLLAPLASLPHVGAVVGANDRERQIRLLRMLQQEIETRRQVMAADPAGLAELPTIVVMVDNYTGFAAAFDDPSDLGIKGALGRIVADGPGVGIVTILTAKQPVGVPAQIASLVPARLLFRLTDRYEYSGMGVAGAEPPAVPGRCYESWTGRELQIARPHRDGIAAAVALLDLPLALDRPPAPVGVLPPEVKVSQIMEAARVFDLEWMLPVGIGDAALAPSGFRLGEGDHVVISGPARSGKSTALATLARVAKAAKPTLHVVAVTPRRSPLRECPEVDTLLDGTEELGVELDDREAVLVLVDDAMMVDDTGGVLSGLAERSRPGVHVVAAAPADMLRTGYSHWTAAMRRSRIGLALKPNVAGDGDLFQTSLPRRGPKQFPAGRGYLIAEGQTELIQVAET